MKPGSRTGWLIDPGMEYDTIIVGGGPAGLSAAIVLGRCGRRVLVVDAGKPRNYASRGVHNFLSRDGVTPSQLKDLGLRELRKYGVTHLDGRVASAECREGGFRVKVAGQRRTLLCRTMLLATGVVDRLPEIVGFEELYGRGVHHCPYCDGWEYTGKRLAAYGKGRRAVGLGMSLLTWSPDVVVLTDGVRVTASERARAEELGLHIRAERVVELVGRRRGGQSTLGRVRFASGEDEAVAALFFNTGQVQRSGLAGGLGCRMNDDGGIVRDRRQRTGVSGLYLAGDASKDVQFVVVAAAEGARAGVAINAELQRRDREGK